MKKMIFLLAVFFLLLIPIANSVVIEIVIEYEEVDWEINPTSFNTHSRLINTETTVGTFFINNTGDKTLSFELIPNQTWISFDTSSTFSLTVAESKNVEVNATVPSVEGTYDYYILVNCTTADTSPQEQKITGKLVATSTVQPYLEAEIVDYPSSTLPSSTIILTSKTTNVGTLDATNVWIAWSLPSGWTIDIGNGNESFYLVQPDEVRWNNITVTVGGEGIYTIESRTNSTEGIGSFDQKSIQVSEEPTPYCGDGNCDAGETCSNCPADCGTCNGDGNGDIVCKPKGLSCVASEECCSPYICVDGVCNDFIALTYVADSEIELKQNESVESILKLTNAGDVDLTNVEITFTDLSAQWYSYTPDSIDKIVPGESRSFIITYKPLEAGTYDFKINIASDETSEIIDVRLVVEEVEVFGICGNDLCEEDYGENCTTCEQDCGMCPEKVERIKETISIILPLLVAFGMIGPGIIAVYMLGFMLVRRCPLCGGKMTASYKGKYITSYSCTKCKHVTMEEKKKT